MKWLFGAIVVVFVAVGGFLLSESPIDSVAWDAPKPQPLDGRLSPNERLREAEMLAQGKVYGPEDTTVDDNGVLYAGTEDGWIVRIWPDGKVENWVHTDGRPLGMVFDKNGQLIVADAWKGLLSISPEGSIRLLTREAKSESFRLTDDVDIAPDGRIYFTDASSRFYIPDFALDMMEMRPHGRLLRYTPSTGKTEVLLDDMYFPNGVAVSTDGKYVLINETSKYRIIRYWITGPDAGIAEVFADNLPGFPDNLAVDDQGRYWVAFPTLRNSQLDSLHKRPWLKDLIAKLPDSFLPVPQRYGLVLVMNGKAEVLASLHDTKGEHLKQITSVNPHGGMLYFGSLHNDRIGKLSIDAIPEIAEPASE